MEAIMRVAVRRRKGGIFTQSRFEAGRWKVKGESWNSAQCESLPRRCETRRRREYSVEMPGACDDPLHFVCGGRSAARLAAGTRSPNHPRGWISAADAEQPGVCVGVSSQEGVRPGSLRIEVWALAEDSKTRRRRWQLWWPSPACTQLVSVGAFWPSCSILRDLRVTCLAETDSHSFWVDWFRCEGWRGLLMVEFALLGCDLEW